MDKGRESKFTITAYNKNGFTKSDDYVLKPLVSSKTNWGIEVNKNDLFIFDRNDMRNEVLDAKVWEIQSANIQSSDVTVSKSDTGNKIDISSLRCGIYQLIFRDKSNKAYSLKFSVNK